MLTFFKFASSGVWQYVAILWTIFSKPWARDLWKLILAGVAEAEIQAETEDGWTGAEKKAFVIRQVQLYQWETGNQVADRVIDTLIQLAVFFFQPETEKSR